MQDIIFRSATRLLDDLKQRRTSCCDLLEAFIARIEAKNPAINAVVAVDYDAARQRAKAADEALRRGEVWGPLHGLPVTIKDTYEVAGLPCTAGLPVHGSARSTCLRRAIASKCSTSDRRLSKVEPRPCLPEPWQPGVVPVSTPKHSTNAWIQSSCSPGCRPG